MWLLVTIAYLGVGVGWVCLTKKLWGPQGNWWMTVIINVLFWWICLVIALYKGHLSIVKIWKSIRDYFSLRKKKEEKTDD